jgi:hypothetical protein
MDSGFHLARAARPRHQRRSVQPVLDLGVASKSCMAQVTLIVLGMVDAFVHLSDLQRAMAEAAFD